MAWHASCQSGKIWADQSDSAYSPLSGWTGASDYVTPNANGIVEHVHVVQDTGHLTSPTRASGVFNLSIALFQNGRKIDTCTTGTVRWAASKE